VTGPTDHFAGVGHAEHHLAARRGVFAVYAAGEGAPASPVVAGGLGMLGRQKS
jgi:hypothetical protein